VTFDILLDVADDMCAYQNVLGTEKFVQTEIAAL